MKKALITILLVLVIVTGVLFAAYEIGIKIVSDKAVKKFVQNEINEMLEEGEISLEEVIQIAELEPVQKEEVTVGEKPEKDKEEESPAQKKPTSASAPKKQEAVEKAADKVNSSIDPKEKREMMDLVRARLTAEDMKYLLSLAAGGLDSKEGSKAVKLAYSRFTAEEIAQLKDFWHRYKALVFTGKPKD